MAGQIPQNFIQDLLSRVDIVDIIHKRVPLIKRGNNFVACCPFHQEKTPSFNVSQDKQLYHCFGCGASGNAIGFVMEYERLDFVDVIEDLASSLNLEVPRESYRNNSSGAPNKPKDNRGYALLEQCVRFFEQQLRRSERTQDVIRYLQSRQLTGKICQQFNIGYAPPAWEGLKRHLIQAGFSEKEGVETGVLIEKNGRTYDRFRDRVMFPIRNRKGQCIGFGGRILETGEPKYLNSPETPFFHKSKELYGLYESRQANREIHRLLIVEGYMDVVALFQHDLPFAVATLGTATSQTHIQQLFRVTNQLCFCFDGDRAGREAAWKALQTTLPLVRGNKQVQFLFLEEGEDPDSAVRALGKEGFLKQLEVEAVNLSDYLIKHLSSQCTISSLEGQRAFLELAQPLLEKIEDSIYLTLLQEKILASTGIDVTMALPNKANEAASGPDRQSLNPLAHAIALVLQFPSLIANILEQTLDISHHGEPGLEVLQALLESIRRRPQISTAELIAHWPQDHPVNQRLARLATWQRPGNEETVADEFLDCLKSLWRDAQQKRLSHIQEIARQRALSSSEKEELRMLLQSQTTAKPEAH